MTTELYAWWLDAIELAGDWGKLTREQMAVLGIHEGEPKAGFYRAPPARSRLVDGATDSFIAIWQHDGEMVAVWDGEPIDACAAWTWCARYPISEDRYRRMEREGFGRAPVSLFA